MPTSQMTRALAAFFGKRAGVVAAYLFGSHAEGRAHRESDVDLAVLLDRTRFPGEADRFEERVRLGSALIDLLDRNEIDVVVLNDAPPLLARRIVTENEALFCSDAAAEHAFLRDTQLRAADLEPFLEKHRQGLLSRLAE